MNYVSNVANFKFFDQELWRWFVGIGALLLIMTAWKVILSYAE